MAQGNSFADQIAKDAARKPVGPVDILPLKLPPAFEERPEYTPFDLELSERLGGQEGKQRWKTAPSSGFGKDLSGLNTPVHPSRRNQVN